jgi:hypothetical protein
MNEEIKVIEKETNVNESTKKDTKTFFVELSQLAPFDCYPKIFQAKYKALKLFWLIIFLLFTSLTLLVLHRSINEYYEYKTVSQIDVIDVDSLAFPTVTICEANPFTTETAQKLLEEKYFEMFQRRVENETQRDILSKMTGNEKGIRAVDMLKVHASSHLFSREMKLKLGSHLRAISFSNFNYVKTVSLVDFSWIYMYEYGNCLQFNSGLDYGNNKQDIHVTELPGEKHGFIFDYRFKNENKYEVSETNGLVVFVHSHLYERPSNSDEGIHLNTGEKSWLSIQRTDTFNHPWPYSNCTDLNSIEQTSSELYVELAQVLNRTSYRQQECLDLCLQRSIVRECKCYYAKYSPVSLFFICE